MCPWDLLSNPVMLLYILNNENKMEILDCYCLLNFNFWTPFFFFKALSIADTETCAADAPRNLVLIVNITNMLFNKKKKGKFSGRKCLLNVDGRSLQFQGL